jgi:hydrogenase maturation factor
MCFTEPGRVQSIDGSIARVATADGVCETSLRIVEAEGRPVVVGDWVLTTLGLVVAVVDEREGMQLFEQARMLRREVHQ